jgi:RimJ/RimL family protein N-acetyltransferase
VSYTIRKAQEDDAAFIQRLFSLPHAREFLNAPARDTIIASIERPNAENYIIEDGGEPVGNLVLHHHGFLVDVAVIVVTQQRRGAGTFGLQWALGHAFTDLQAHRVFAETREDNVGTRRLLERLGFVQEGLYRDGFQDERTGEFKNLCPYGLLEDEYRAG